jgi:serine/threonine-protein kinase RsbW/sigma-B regulation protein RsbU (phosphoserine phosphatase)
MRKMKRELRLTLANELSELTRVGALARSFLERSGIAEELVYRVDLVLEEVLSNVIRHAYAEAEPREIGLYLGTDGGHVDLQVVDDGREFDPLTAPEVDVHAPLEERTVGGLGIHLLRTFANDVRYRRRNGRNHLHVRLAPAG